MAIDTHYRYRFGTFSIDTQERLLLCEGKHVPLKQKGVETLTLLLRESPRVVEKDRFMQEVWPDAFVEEGNLTQHVFALRKALGESSGEARYIETVSRRGYRFIAQVKEVRDSGAEVVVERHARARVVIEGEQSKTIDSLAVLPLANMSATRASNTSRTARQTPL